MLRKFRYQLTLIALILVVPMSIAGCGQGTSSYGAPAGSATSPPSAANTPSSVAAEVRIANFSFQPTEVTIKPGQSVRWTNGDSAAHTVTGSGFDSGNLSQGQTYTHAFASAGTFDYRCSIHSNMLGKVIVQP